MALLEALSSTELLNFLIYDTTIAAAASHDSSDATLILENNCPKPQQGEEEVEVEAKEGVEGVRKRVPRRRMTRDKTAVTRNALAAQQGVRKKRKRRPRVCKNKEEAENQRMTHIAVERNRRKQMNEHLAVLRSLIPESYVQRGDQASIVGGAVEFVKELEHLLQNLEAQKLQLLQRGRNPKSQNQDNNNKNDHHDEEDEDDQEHVTNIFLQPPFSQFFLYPQITWYQSPNNNNLTTASVADIEVTLIETHANIRILSRRNPRHLLKLVAGFHSLRLAILHLSVTTLDPLVLYSISAKVEEGCQLSTVDDIAGAVHHMLRIIEDSSFDSGSRTKYDYQFVDAISPIDVNEDHDCLQWSNDQRQLCYGCDTCKAGLFASLKAAEWRRANVVLTVALMGLVYVYVIGRFTFRRATRSEDLFRRYKQGYT